MCKVWFLISHSNFLQIESKVHKKGTFFLLFQSDAWRSKVGREKIKCTLQRLRTEKEISKIAVYCFYFVMLTFQMNGHRQ